LYWLGVEGVTYQRSGDSYQLLPDVVAAVDKASKEAGMESRFALAKLYGLGFAFFQPKTFPPPDPMLPAYRNVVYSDKQLAAMAMTRPYLTPLIPRPVFT